MWHESNRWKLFLCMDRCPGFCQEPYTLYLPSTFYLCQLRADLCHQNMSAVGEKCHTIQAQTNSCWCQCLCTLVRLCTYTQGKLWLEVCHYGNDHALMEDLKYSILKWYYSCVVVRSVISRKLFCWLIWHTSVDWLLQVLFHLLLSMQILLQPQLTSHSVALVGLWSSSGRGSKI